MDEVDMSIDSSIAWTAASLLDHLTPPPSRDHHDIKTSAFMRAGQIYQSFETGLHTPETQAESSTNQNESAQNQNAWSMRDYKRRRTSEILNAEPEETYNNLQHTSDVVPGTMNDLEDDLANTSIIEYEQALLHTKTDQSTDIGMDYTSEYGIEATERQLSEQPEILGELDGLRQKENINTIAQPSTQWQRNYSNNPIKLPQASVNEMTVVASVVGEVLMETIK